MTVGWVGLAVSAAGVAVNASSASSARRSQERAAADAMALEQQTQGQNRRDSMPWLQGGRQGLNELLRGFGLQPGGGAPITAPVESAETFDAQAYLAQNPDVARVGMNPWLHFQQYGRDEGRAFAWTPEAQYQREQAAAQATPGAAPAPGAPAAGDFNRDFTLDDFRADPGMQFRMRTGQEALETSAAARGGLLSGSHLKDLTRYGQEFGSQEFGDAYNRWNADRDRRFGRLSQLAGIGQTTSRDVNAGRTSSTANINEWRAQGANASAAGRVATGNAVNQGLTSLGNWAQRQSMQPATDNRSSFRYDDPYRSPSYVGGMEGE